jgi:hypothetical protein
MIFGFLCYLELTESVSGSSLSPLTESDYCKSEGIMPIGLSSKISSPSMIADGSFLIYGFCKTFSFNPKIFDLATLNDPPLNIGEGIFDLCGD